MAKPKKAKAKTASKKKPASGGKALNVLVSDEYLSRVGEVADRLRSAGMQVGKVMTNSGTIEGRVASKHHDHLKGIEGVAAIEEARELRIAPPDSDLQ
jgi:hypothetical protein